MIIGIDATRNRSGGAKIHLKGILDNFRSDHGITKVHVWSYPSLLDVIPDYPWLEKHTHSFINKSLFWQIFWQKFILPRELIRNSCDILLSTDAGTFCRFAPNVVMSRDMLSYEEGMIDRYPKYSFSWLRLHALRYVQSSNITNADGVIFLTKYAKDVIGKYSPSMKSVTIIPHGVTDVFRGCAVGQVDKKENDQVVITYVSNVAPYKNQISVLQALKLLLNDFNLKLNLIGGGAGFYYDSVMSMLKSDKELSSHVELYPQLSHVQIAEILKSSDLFLFASSCENMPNTLVEGMSSGLPIVCSNKGPMPEVLEGAGLYFDPNKPEEIAASIRKVLLDRDLMKSLSQQSLELSTRYSWKKCSEETFAYVAQTFRNYKDA